MAEIDITQMLLEWSAGNGDALDRLLPAIYDQLRASARVALRRERPDHTVQPTALVHEAYLRLVNQNRVVWRDRTHFLAVAAMTMRRVLLDYAKAAQAEKRGANMPRASIRDSDAVDNPVELDVLELHAALDRLAAIDPRKAQVVEMKFYGGMTIDEIAAYLNVATGTVERDWKLAKSWLYRELERAQDGGLEA